MRLAIGGMGIDVVGDGGLDLLARLPGFGVFVNDGVGADLRVRLDAAGVPREARWLHRFSIVDDTMECRFGRLPDGRYLYRFGDEGALLCPPAGREAEEPYRLSPVVTPAVMRFAVWLAVSMGGARLGRLPVHASAVVHGGRAVLCLGESGTGKSTHTRLWLENVGGCHLLNDDSPILAHDADGWHAYGSPWSGKTPCFRAERWPVAALVRIEQRPQNGIARLGVIQAFAALQPSCPPCLMMDEPLQDALVGYVGRAIEGIPVYRLGCRPDREAAILCHDTIFAQQ